MKMYRSISGHDGYKEHEVIKNTNVYVTYITEHGFENKESKKTGAFIWHETEIEAIQYHINRNKSIILRAKNSISHAEASIELLELKYNQLRYS